MDDGHRILLVGVLLAAGLAASLLAGRLRVPSLLLFLGLGMAIGSDGGGLIDFDDYGLARTIGVVALALILVEGGLRTGVRELRPVLAPALGLAVVGTAMTAGVTGLAASWLFDLRIREGLLLGAVVAATEGAAVFGLLRGAALPPRVRQVLEGEAGLNDPVAVVLVLGLIEALRDPTFGLADGAELLVRQLGLGGLVGVLVGVGAVRALRAARLATPGLYPAASVAAAAMPTAAPTSSAARGSWPSTSSGWPSGPRRCRPSAWS